jgi:hypothetical protein
MLLLALKGVQEEAAQKRGHLNTVRASGFIHNSFGLHPCNTRERMGSAKSTTISAHRTV